MVSHRDSSSAATQWLGSRDSSRRRRRPTYTTSLLMPGVAGLGGPKDERKARELYMKADISKWQAPPERELNRFYSETQWKQAWGSWRRLYFYVIRGGRLRRPKRTR